MASFGHIALGMVTGRLHGGRRRIDDPRFDWRPLALFAALSAAPDADVLLVALGARDSGAGGHRGASHSLLMAAGVGLVCAAIARTRGWPVWRTAIAGALAVASHGLLDALGAGGKGIMLLWPLSSTRFHSPWRLFPDAPRGLRLLSAAGLGELCTEFALFLPLTLYALGPRLGARRRAWRAQRSGHPPSLRLVQGGATGEDVRFAATVGERDPSLRSSG